MMRTTINLPDDIYEAARSIAHAKRISLGDALAGLARNGLNPEPSIDYSTPCPRFAPRKGAPPITLEATLEAEDEL
jgi:hypothetical protein